jgi:CheY-like chemotaxis protein
MPVMDGFEVLEWFRRFKGGKDLAIAVMTASNDELDREKALSLGAAAYYIKPVGFRDLTAIAREIRERWLNGA